MDKQQQINFTEQLRKVLADAGIVNLKSDAERQRFDELIANTFAITCAQPASELRSSQES